MSPATAHRLLREASLELARLRRIRGASHKTWRRIARARKRLALAAALLAAPVADPAAAVDPLLLSHGLPLDYPPLSAPAGVYGGHPAFADIDGDGDADLFVGGTTGNIFFLRNTGSAAQPALAPAQTNPFGLVDVGTTATPSFADLDADGDLDALVGTGSNQAWFFQNTGSAASPAFAAPVINAFGLTTRVFELADLDGDGDFDASRTVSGATAWFENTGSAAAPAFAAAVTNPFGLAGAAFTFADLDADGDLDGLTGTADFSYRVVFFENTGSATAPGFAAPDSDALGDSFLDQTRADFADLDGDGDLDGLSLGTVFEASANLWLENVGGPGAAAFTSLGNRFGLGSRIDHYTLAGYAYPSYGASCSLADLDGDGDLDSFIRPDEFEENVGGPNAPAFASVPIETLALSGNEAVLADLDADGDTDALVGVSSGELLFFENTGAAGGPAFAAPLSGPFGLADVGDSASPELGDLDGDGDLDALVGSATGDAWFFENTGSAASPAFATAVANPFGLSNLAGYASPALVDIDGDGDLDVVAGAFTGSLFFFANTGSAAAPAFAGPAPNAFGFADVGSYASPDLADVDGDGDPDAFVGDAAGNVWFFRNTGTAGAPALAQRELGAPGIRFDDAGSYATPELADADGDGVLDAVIGSVSGAITYYPNAGTPAAPRFVRPSSANPFGLSLSGEPELVDLDADGDEDLFSGTTWSENTGGASAPGFGASVSQPFGLASVFGLAAPAFADLDADGDRDALIGTGDGNLVFFANTGAASAPAFGSPTTNPFGLADVGSYASPDLADLDGDGDLDLLVGAYDGNTRFFRNTGSAASPAFGPPLVNPFGLVDVWRRAAPEIADLDGDGDLDVVVGDQLRRLSFFENVSIDADACTDGLDNDGDGRTDLGNDPGCASTSDTSELGTRQCDNGLDDDADGKIDWRGDASGDPECSGLLDDREMPDPPSGGGCGLGPELLLLGPLLAAVRRRRGSYTAPSCPSPTPPPTSSSSADR